MQPEVTSIRKKKKEKEEGKFTYTKKKKKHYKKRSQMKKKAQEKKRNIYGRKTLLPVVMARAAYKYSHFDVLQDSFRLFSETPRCRLTQLNCS